MGKRGLSLSLSLKHVLDFFGLMILGRIIWLKNLKELTHGMYEFADGVDVWVFSGRYHNWVDNSMQGLGTSSL